MKKCSLFPILATAAWLLALAPAAQAQARGQLWRKMKVELPVLMGAMDPGSITGSILIRNEKGELLGEIKKWGDELLIEQKGTYDAVLVPDEVSQRVSVNLSFIVDDRAKGGQGVTTVIHLDGFGKSVEATYVRTTDASGHKRDKNLSPVLCNAKADPLFTVK
jgi:hypothetical protein